MQSYAGLCGQACVAMLAGISIDKAISIMHCNKWQASMGKIIESLDYFGISHADKVTYTKGKSVALPKCCIIISRTENCSHYIIYFDGKYYDSASCIKDEYETDKIVGYLKINI